MLLAQVGQRPLVEELQLLVERLAGLPFQHFEQQGELGDLHRLGVDVHAVDVVQEDALALGGGEPPSPPWP